MWTDPPAPETPMPRPHFIAHRGQHLFSWYHPARPSVRRGAAVVLCPALGGEYVRVYRVWRMLAGELADIGFDVVRFDYEGTGDSSGDCEEPDRVEAWLQNIERVAKEARDLSGSTEVALVGLRIGALLAAHGAAACGGVSRLVLWSPFRSGRAFVRELKALARLSGEDHIAKGEEGPDLIAAGYVLPGPIASSLERMNLDTLSTCPAREILLVDRDDRSADSWIAEHFETLGASVARCRPAGTSSMLNHAASLTTPRDALAAITSWFAGWQPDSAQRVRRAERTAGTAESTHGSAYQERAVRFGPDGRLFGILSVPNGAGAGAPAIVLLNTGFEYHVGPHRAYVPLAREWSAKGHVILRYDLGGVGDSEAPRGAADNVAYPPHALDDAREAIAFVRKEAPNRPLIAAGLCSGAWHVFRAAREGLDVDAIVSVNAPLFLHDGVPSCRAWSESQQIETYRTALGDPARWAKAMWRPSSWTSFVQFAARYASQKARSLLGASFGGRLLDGLARDLNVISARGITTLFVFSRGESGLEYFQLHAGAALRLRRVRQHIRFVVVDGAGHTFTPPAAQQALRQLLIDFVLQQTPRCPEGPPESPQRWRLDDWLRRRSTVIR
jgi:alpha-beta hydrolase superfamily lysophospholipase